MSVTTNNDNFGVLSDAKLQNGIEQERFCEKCCFKWKQRKDHCYGYYFSPNVLHVKKINIYLA